MWITDSVAISLVGACATVGASLINAIFAYLSNRRSKRNEEHLVEAKDTLHALKIQTDGMQDQLIRTVGEAEHAKGVKQAEDASGRQDQLIRSVGQSEHAKGVKEGEDAANSRKDPPCNYPR